MMLKSIKKENGIYNCISFITKNSFFKYQVRRLACIKPQIIMSNKTDFLRVAFTTKYYEEDEVYEIDFHNKIL